MSSRGEFRRAYSSHPALQATYFNSGGRVLQGWQPAVRRQADEIKGAGHKAAARAIDALHNSGWLAGAIETTIAMMIGTGLQLNAKPDGDILGWSVDSRNKWCKLVERRWQIWSETPQECDAAGRMTIAQMQAMALRTWYGHGEYIITSEIIARPGVRTKTKINLVDPLALSRYETTNQADQGVIIDSYGAPQGYVFTYRNPKTLQEKKKVVPARSETGRPLVGHFFDGAAQQRRGITPLAPALRVVRQYDQLADATLTTTLLQTIFAAVIKSTMPTDEVFNAIRTQGDQESPADTALGQYMQESAAWYQNSSLDLGDHGRIAHLFPNEELDFKAAQHPTSMYESFSQGLLREVARCIPMSYEEFTGDYRGATYSSVRMATSTHWPTMLYRRKHIAAPLAQMAYECWLEEEIAAGEIPFPGGHPEFIRCRSFASRADWRGPARPTADDEKTANAQRTRLENGLSTFEAECAEQGLDWEEVMHQRAREAAMAKQLGLTIPGVTTIADAPAQSALPAPGRATDADTPERLEYRQAQEAMNG